MEYQRDSKELYWDVIYLMTAHYSGDPGKFDRACLSIAERIGATDDVRSNWIRHMVKTQKVPTREWEDGLWSGENS